MSNDISNYMTASDVELIKTVGYTGSSAVINNTQRFSAVTIDLTSYTKFTSDLKHIANGGVDGLYVRIYKRRALPWAATEIFIREILLANTTLTELTQPLEIDTTNPGMGPGIYRFAYESSGGTNTWNIDHQGRYARLIIE